MIEINYGLSLLIVAVTILLLCMSVPISVEAAWIEIDEDVDRLIISPVYSICGEKNTTSKMQFTGNAFVVGSHPYDMGLPQDVVSKFPPREPDYEIDTIFSIKGNVVDETGKVIGIADYHNKTSYTTLNSIEFPYFIPYDIAIKCAAAEINTQEEDEGKLYSDTIFYGITIDPNNSTEPVTIRKVAEVE